MGTEFLRTCAVFARSILAFPVQTGWVRCVKPRLLSLLYWTGNCRTMYRSQFRFRPSHFLLSTTEIFQGLDRESWSKLIPTCWMLPTPNPSTLFQVRSNWRTINCAVRPAKPLNPDNASLVRAWSKWWGHVWAETGRIPNGQWSIEKLYEGFRFIASTAWSGMDGRHHERGRRLQLPLLGFVSDRQRSLLIRPFPSKVQHPARQLGNVQPILWATVLWVLLIRIPIARLCICDSLFHWSVANPISNASYSTTEAKLSRIVLMHHSTLLRWSTVSGSRWKLTGAKSCRMTLATSDTYQGPHKTRVVQHDTINPGDAPREERRSRSTNLSKSTGFRHGALDHQAQWWRLAQHVVLDSIEIECRPGQISNEAIDLV